MDIKGICPFDDGEVICVAGRRYRPKSKDPETQLPQDLDGLIFVGQCTRCAKATKMTDKTVEAS